MLYPFQVISLLFAGGVKPCKHYSLRSADPSCNSGTRFQTDQNDVQVLCQCQGIAAGPTAVSLDEKLNSGVARFCERNKQPGL